jgi:hypothetical protein
MEPTSHPRAHINQGIADQTVSLYPSSALSDHPLLAHIPVWKRDEPEFASLLESIRGRGLDYPVLIDSEQRVVDGRNRRNALSVLGQPVPCRVVGAGEAASIAIASLVNRRHLNKGALAYLSAPLFAEALAESKARNLAMLKAGRVSVPYSVGNAPKTVEDIAAQVGVSLALMEQALRLRAMFAELGDEVRAKYEPRILGDWIDEDGVMQRAVGLGYMVNGLTSLIEESKGKTKNLGKRSQHDRLFVSFFPKLKTHWAKANEEQRAAIAERTKAEVLKWPADLREEIAAALKSAARAEQA